MASVITTFPVLAQFITTTTVEDADGNPVTDADVAGVFQAIDRSGSPFGAEIAPFDFVHTGSGFYRYEHPAIEFEDRQRYRMTITVEVGGVVVDTRQIVYTATLRNPKKL